MPPNDDELAAARQELADLRAELEETNRGVEALNAELDERAIDEKLDRAIAAFAVWRKTPFDERSAGRAAKIRYDLERSGIAIGPTDVLIAGTALAHGARLVTHNITEFGRVPGLEIEDWF